MGEDTRFNTFFLNFDLFLGRRNIDCRYDVGPFLSLISFFFSFFSFRFFFSFLSFLFFSFLINVLSSFLIVSTFLFFTYLLFFLFHYISLPYFFLWPGYLPTLYY